MLREITNIGRNNLVQTSYRQPDKPHSDEASGTLNVASEVDENSSKEAFAAVWWDARIYHKDHPSLQEQDPNYKTKPYRSATVIPPVNLNCEVPFASSESEKPQSEEIECRHIVTQYIVDIWDDESGDGKVNLSHYANKENLAAHIPPGIDALADVLKINAKRYDLMATTALGEYLHARFSDMQQAEPKATLRTFYLSNGNHAMAIRLRIKGSSDEPIYVVSFLDPNVTNSAVRVRTSDVSEIKSHSLEYYINGSHTKGEANNHYDYYFSGSDHLCMVLEIDKTSFVASPSTRPRLSTPITEPLTPALMHLLCMHNLADDLLGLAKQLQDIGDESQDDLLDLLIARSQDNVPGFFIMMQDGCANTVTAYCQLLTKLLPQMTISARDALMDNFFATHHEDDLASGLSVAVSWGITNTITALGNALPTLLPILNPKERGKLMGWLEASTCDFHRALKAGEVKTITAFGDDFLCKLAPRLSKREQQHFLEVVAAENEDGVPGLAQLFLNGKVDALQAHLDVLSTLRPLLHKEIREDVIDILAAIDSDGKPGLLTAWELNQTDAIDVYGDLPAVMNLDVDERSKLADLLVDLDEEFCDSSAYHEMCEWVDRVLRNSTHA